MGPSVGGEMVTLVDFTLGNLRVLDHIAADQEERSREFVGLEVIQQGRRGKGGTIIKGQAPGVRLRKFGEILGSASLARPVAFVWKISRGACWRSTDVKRNFGRTTEVTEFLEPGLDLRSVGWGNLVGSGVV